MTITTRLLCALGGGLAGVLAVLYARFESRSRVHPLVGMTGVVFMFILAPRCTTVESVFLGVSFLAVALVVCICDWAVLRIPNMAVAAGACAALGIVSLFGIDTAASRIISALAAGAIMLALYLLGAAIFQREAMGIGDIKLGAMLGCYLDLNAFLFSLWLAAIIGLIAGPLCGRRMPSGWFHFPCNSTANGRPRYEELPFGAFLCLSSAIVYLFGDAFLPEAFSILAPV